MRYCRVIWSRSAGNITHCLKVEACTSWARESEFICKKLSNGNVEETEAEGNRDSHNYFCLLGCIRIMSNCRLYSTAQRYKELKEPFADSCFSDVSQRREGAFEDVAEQSALLTGYQDTIVRLLFSFGSPRLVQNSHREYKVDKDKLVSTMNSVWLDIGMAVFIDDLQKWMVVQNVILTKTPLLIGLA